MLLIGFWVWCPPTVLSNAAYHTDLRLWSPGKALSVSLWQQWQLQQQRQVQRGTVRLRDRYCYIGDPPEAHPAGYPQSCGDHVSVNASLRITVSIQ